MPIRPDDIVLRLSGGPSNNDPILSLGGSKSSLAVSTSPASVFDNVKPSESTNGSIEYRCLYVHNNHTNLIFENASIWVSSNTTSNSTAISIAVGSSSVNGTEQSVSGETNAPVGVAFSSASTSGTALGLGNIPPGQHKAFWLRRSVAQGAGAFNNDSATLEINGGYTE